MRSLRMLAPVMLMSMTACVTTPKGETNFSAWEFFAQIWDFLTGAGGRVAEAAATGEGSMGPVGWITTGVGALVAGWGTWRTGKKARQKLRDKRAQRDDENAEKVAEKVKTKLEEPTAASSTKKQVKK